MNFEVYCDESRQEFFKHQPPGEHFVLIGGVWIKADDRSRLKEELKALREKHSVHGEFKWQRVSPSKLDFYLDLAELFFRQDVRFRVVVLRSDELDAVKFHASDNELMFYKFYYQLIHHWVLDRNSYQVFVDTKTNRLHDRLRVLERCLQNANLLSELTVQALPSHQVDLIQLADVLIGAVGYRLHRLSTSAAKTQVVERIEERLKHEIWPTSRSEEKFNVFRFQPQGGW